MLFTREAAERWQKRPDLFMEEILGVELESYQRKICLDIAENPRVCIAAVHGVGKSFIMARVVIWFLLCFPGSKIVTSAPSFRQVQSILWSEIRTAVNKAKVPLGGQLNLTDWKLDDDWFALGYSPKNEVTGGEGQGTASTFQGIHSPYVLVVLDEATGIQRPIWIQAEGLLTSQFVRFVAIGNPTSRNSEFFNCFRSAAWKKVYLSCFDSPNLIANGLTNMAALERELAHVKALGDAEAQRRVSSYKVVKPHLLNAGWVVASVLKWGITHPLTVGKVFGKFPEQSDGALISLGWIEEAQLREHAPVEGERKIIGVDVARFGTDSTVLTGMHGAKQLSKKALQKRDTVAVTGEIIALMREMDGVDVIVVDETGLGGGVVDLLREAQSEGTIDDMTEIRGVQFGAAVECQGSDDCDHKECDKARYVNVKARMFGLLAEDIKTTLQLLPESVYLEELPTILYKYDSKGRLTIESKQDYKKRTGLGSPDHADSLALANYGRYDEIQVGFLDSTYTSEFGTPFAASLRQQKEW